MFRTPSGNSSTGQLNRTTSGTGNAPRIFAAGQLLEDLNDVFGVDLDHISLSKENDHVKIFWRTEIAFVIEEAASAVQEPNCKRPKRLSIYDSLQLGRFHLLAVTSFENFNDVFRVDEGPVLLTEKKDNVEILWRAELVRFIKEIAHTIR